MPFIGGGSGGGGGYTPPAVGDDDLVEDEDVTLTGNVLTGDMTEVVKFSFRPADGQPALEFQANETAPIPARGTVFIGDDGALEVVPAANVSGPLPTIRTWQTNGTDLRFANISVTFTPANDAPIARDGSDLSFEGEDVSLDLFDFSSDPDGDTLTLTHLDGDPVDDGTPVAVTGGTITYRADLAPSRVLVSDLVVGVPCEFGYTVSDGALSASGTVTITVGVTIRPLFNPEAPITSSDDDQAAVNFGKTYRAKYGPLDNNGVNVAVPPYSPGQGYFELTNREPWLYDRATTLYMLAKRTNDAVILAEAMDLAELYMAGVNVSGTGLGTFTIIGNTGGDPQDAKYLYGIVGWWYEREVLAAGGTTQEAQVYRPKVTALYRQTLISWGLYDAGTAELWTERNAWAAITNCLSAHWNGDGAALGDANIFANDVIAMSAATGVPAHTKDKHEQDGDPTPIISPWMLHLLAKAMTQLHRTTGSVGLAQDIREWLSGVGDWLHDHAFYVAAGDEEPELIGLAGLRLPAYLVGQSVQFPEGEANDMQHARDVASLIRLCIAAKLDLDSGADVTDLDDLVDELEAAALVDDAYWTRTTEGYPHYRVNPPRKYGWQRRENYGNIYTFDLVPFPPDNITAPVVSGSTQQGATLTTTDGVWAGTPAPTFTYQWQRFDVTWIDIVGETAATYDTVEDDIGTQVRCAVTGTNGGGEDTAFSNALSIVAAGSPEVTVHPSNQTALETETATFHAECNATPTATYQWEISTNGGSTWANVSEGTGGSGTGNTTDYVTEALEAADTGRQYRCVFTNTGGSVNTNAATLSMVVQQDAVRFIDSTDGATLTFTLGNTGFTEWTVAGFFAIENSINSGTWVSCEGVASRTFYCGRDNAGVPHIGDSNTGFIGGDWDVDPPTDGSIFFMVVRGAAIHPGTFTGRWYTEDGTLGGTASRANGIEDSLSVEFVHLNGATEPGQTMRAQYVRGYSRRLSDGECDAEYANTNMATTNLEWFNVFEDDGGGGVTVRDATGNNREFVLTGATLSSNGPVAPTVP
jgi:hypothetical protein